MGKTAILWGDQFWCDSTTDKPSLEQQFHKLMMLLLLCEKTGAAVLVLPGLMVSWLAGWQAKYC